MKVKECMCADVVFVKPDTAIKDVAKHMQECHVGCIPVCDDENKVVGIVTDRDLILRCIACDKDYKNTPVSEIMTTEVKTVCAEDPITQAIDHMCNCQIKRIPVQQNGAICGIITFGDLARNSDMSDTKIGETSKNICQGNKNKA